MRGWRGAQPSTGGPGAGGRDSGQHQDPLCAGDRPVAAGHTQQRQQPCLPEAATALPHARRLLDCGPPVCALRRLPSAPDRRPTGPISGNLTANRPAESNSPERPGAPSSATPQVLEGLPVAVRRRLL